MRPSAPANSNKQWSKSIVKSHKKEVREQEPRMCIRWIDVTISNLKLEKGPSPQIKNRRSPSSRSEYGFVPIWLAPCKKNKTKHRSTGQRHVSCFVCVLTHEADLLLHDLTDSTLKKSGTFIFIICCNGGESWFKKNGIRNVAIFEKDKYAFKCGQRGMPFHPLGLKCVCGPGENKWKIWLWYGFLTVS